MEICFLFLNKIFLRTNLLLLRRAPQVIEMKVHHILPVLLKGS